MKKLWMIMIAAMLCTQPAAGDGGVPFGGLVDSPAGGEVCLRATCPILHVCYPVHGPRPTGLAWDGSMLWAAYHFGNLIHLIDPADCSATIRSIHAPEEGISGLAFDGTNLWACQDNSVFIYKIDPADGSALHVIPTPGTGNAAGLAWDGTALWHADYEFDTVYKLDPADGSVLDSFPAPGDLPTGLGYHGGHLVLADKHDDMLYLIDPASGTVLNQCASPGLEPWGVAFTGMTIWTTSFEGDDRQIYEVLGFGPISVDGESWGAIKNHYK